MNIVGERVALGPLRKDLVPLYGRWRNDLGAARMLGNMVGPVTAEVEGRWHEEQVKTEDRVFFTSYEREALRPVGGTNLFGVDFGNRHAGIVIGEPEYRGRGLGTEMTRLMPDYAFTALGLHNVMLTVFEFNPAGTRFRSC